MSKQNAPRTYGMSHKSNWIWYRTTMPSKRTQRALTRDHDDNTSHQEDGEWPQVTPNKRRKKASGLKQNDNNNEYHSKGKSSSPKIITENSFKPFMILLVGIPGSGEWARPPSCDISLPLICSFSLWISLFMKREEHLCQYVGQTKLIEICPYLSGCIED